jgi:hypothetical protein
MANGNGKGKGTSGKPKNPAPSTAAIAQAVARGMSQGKQKPQQPTKPKPKAKPKPQRPKAKSAGLSRSGLRWAFSGFHKGHMPTDESTAPYTVSNFVDPLEFTSSPTMDKIVVIAPSLAYAQATSPQSMTPGSPITDVIAAEFDASTDPNIPNMQALSVLRSSVLGKPVLTASSQFFATRARLHNLSISLECLGTNEGLIPAGSVYVGLVPLLPHGPISAAPGGVTTIKEAWAEHAISVGYLKSITAKALSARPCIVDAAVAESIDYKAWHEFVLTPQDFNLLPEHIQNNVTRFSNALEPIVLYIPRAGGSNTVVNYRVTVGQQWCTRHPDNVLLRATQRHRSPTTPSMWNEALKSIREPLAEFAASQGPSLLRAGAGYLGTMAGM